MKKSVLHLQKVEEKKTHAEELHRRYLSKKISEVLLEIDAINHESGFNHHFEAKSLLKEDGKLLEKYRATLAEAKAFKR